MQLWRIFEIVNKKRRVKIMDGNLPEDAMMLLSVVNMKLRDQYGSLDEMCDDLGVSREEIVEKLKTIGMEYSPEQNKFW